MKHDDGGLVLKVGSAVAVICIAVAVIVGSQAHAEGPYLELGMWHAIDGAHFRGDGDAKSLDMQPLERVPEPVVGPFGSVELGYSFSTDLGDTSLSFFHLSSVSSGRDKGANMVGVTHRFSQENP